MSGMRHRLDFNWVRSLPLHYTVKTLHVQKESLKEALLHLEKHATPVKCDHVHGMRARHASTERE